MDPPAAPRPTSATSGTTETDASIAAAQAAELQAAISTSPAAAVVPVEQPSIHEETFKRLQRDFQETLAALSAQPALQKFRLDYEQVFATMCQARDNELRLLSKLHDIHAEVSATNTKMAASMKISHADRITIANLKKEVKKAWAMVEEASEREVKSKETVTHLRLEVSELQQTLQQSTTATIGQEQSVNELIRQKEELTKERDIQLNQIMQVRTEIAEAADRARVLESANADHTQEIHHLKELIATKKSEADKELRIKERLERELKDARALIEQKAGEVRTKNESLSRSKEELAKLEQLIRDQKITIEKCNKEYEHVQSKCAKLQQDYEDQLVTTNQLLAENRERAADLKTQESDLAQIKDELRLTARVKDTLQRKTKTLEEDKQKAETDRIQLKAIIQGLEKDADVYKKNYDSDKRQIEELSRERDLINRNLQKSSSATQKQINLVRIHEQTQRNLEQDIVMYKEEVAKQRKVIHQLEKERDRYFAEATQIQAQVVESIDEMKHKESQMHEIKKKMGELESKLKQQQSLYETVRSDRNVYSKNLAESQENISEMKRKLKATMHQIDQLKDEIQSKDSALAKEHIDLVRLDKEKESLKNEIQKLKQQSEMAQQYIQNQQSEENKLRSLAAEADTERQRQKKEYEAVVQERDILGAQLVRRNDELAIIYEKIKLQQSTLNKGEAQYRERLEDIRVLKLEIKRLRQECALLQRDNAGHDGLKTEIVRLQREIIAEKSRAKVLEEELENPVNIHRWRKLEGTDLESFELIQKVQSLQKRLIAKTEEVVEKELAITQKERMYKDLKSLMARQPGPEVVEQVNNYQHAIKDKTNQLKAMASELNMYQAHVTEYKHEIEYLQREMQSIKKRYFEQKKKQTAAKLDISTGPGTNSKVTDAFEHIVKQQEASLAATAS